MPTPDAARETASHREDVRWARLAALGQLIVGGLDGPAAEQAVVDAAREVLGTDAAAYARVSADPPAFEIRAISGGSADLARLMPVGADVASQLAIADVPLIGSDAFRITEVATAPPSWRAIMRRLGLSSVATVLVGRTDRPIGILGVATAESRKYDGEDIAIVQALASLLAGAVERTASERAVGARIRQLETLADLGSQVIVGLGLPRLAERIVQILAEQHEADAAAVLRIVDHGRYALVAGVGVDRADIAMLEGDPGGIGAAAIASDEAVIVGDLRIVPSPISLLASRIGVTSLVLARVGDPDAPFGLVGMGSRQAGRFGQDDAAFVRGLANLLASAIALEEATASIADQARRIEEVRFEERTALAREIHDGLVQDLWLTRLHLGLLSEAIADGGEVAPRLEELGMAIDRASEDARQAVMTLRATDGEGASLAGDLATYAADLGRRLGILIDTRIQSDLPELPPRTQAELLRIVQEILVNAARHADATRVVVETSNGRRGLRIAVLDDGRGFDPRATVTGGAGLTGMRERAALIGAAISIRSAPGHGTTVAVTLPRRAWSPR